MNLEKIEAISRYVDLQNKIAELEKEMIQLKIDKGLRSVNLNYFVSFSTALKDYLGEDDFEESLEYLLATNVNFAIAYCRQQRYTKANFKESHLDAAVSCLYEYPEKFFRIVECSTGKLVVNPYEEKHLKEFYIRHEKTEKRIYNQVKHHNILLIKYCLMFKNYIDEEVINQVSNKILKFSKDQFLENILLSGIPFTQETLDKLSSKVVMNKMTK